MQYLEDRGVIVMREDEIFDNPEYEHIQEIINNHPAPDVHDPNHFEVHDQEYGNILIFRVLKTYEGKNKLEDGLLFVDLLCLCVMDILIGFDTVCINTSDLTHLEQLREIRLQYHEFNIPEVTTLPKNLADYGDRTYAIIPIRFDHQLGFIEEFEK